MEPRHASRVLLDTISGKRRRPYYCCFGFVDGQQYRGSFKVVPIYRYGLHQCKNRLQTVCVSTTHVRSNTCSLSAESSRTPKQPGCGGPNLARWTPRQIHVNGTVPSAVYIAVESIALAWVNPTPARKSPACMLPAYDRPRPQRATMRPMPTLVTHRTPHVCSAYR